MPEPRRCGLCGGLMIMHNAPCRPGAAPDVWRASDLLRELDDARDPPLPDYDEDPAPGRRPVADQDDMAVRLAAQAIVCDVLDVLYDDPHQWSKRPCATCQTVSSLVGRDFGCVRYAKKDGKS